MGCEEVSAAAVAVWGGVAAAAASALRPPSSGRGVGIGVGVVAVVAAAAAAAVVGGCGSEGQLYPAFQPSMGNRRSSLCDYARHLSCQGPCLLEGGSWSLRIALPEQVGYVSSYGKLLLCSFTRVLKNELHARAIE